MPRNKFSVWAALWFAAAVYALIFREADGGAPPFAHFDKVAHFSLFFAQIWLAAKAFISAQRAVPYRGLAVFALVFALSSEWAQAAFTATRQGTAGDALADMLGCAAALWLAKRVAAAKTNRNAV